jgi:thymidylate kinase
MITIVEGPDGAGKTTLALALGGRYHHEGPPPPGDGSLLAYYADFIRPARWAERRVVLDRLALGELVYGPLLRGRSRLSEREFRAFQETAKSAGAVTILCLPPYLACLENWRRRRALGRELFAKEDLFRRAYDGFLRLADEADVVYDYTRSEAA